MLCITQINVAPGKVNVALEALGRTSGDLSLGRLRACFHSEIGRLNRILAIHEHPSAEATYAALDRTLRSGDPFGVAEHAQTIESEPYAMFPGVEFMAPGKVGPVFEVRTYQLKRGGLEATFAAWHKVLEARTRLSGLAAVMYGLSGSVPRFMHIWPYASLDARMSIRERSVREGIWPPPGGLPHIESMQSEIYLPAAFSPLH